MSDWRYTEAINSAHIYFLGQRTEYGEQSDGGGCDRQKRVTMKLMGALGGLCSLDRATRSSVTRSIHRGTQSSGSEVPRGYTTAESLRQWIPMRTK